MRDLFREVLLQDYSRKNEKESCDGRADNPSETMTAVSGYEGQRTCEEDDKAYDQVNPTLMSIEFDGREEYRKKRYNNAVHNASR